MAFSITGPIIRHMAEDSAEEREEDVEEDAEEDAEGEFDLGEEIDELVDTSLYLTRLEKAALFLLVGAPVAVLAKATGGSSLLTFVGAAMAMMPLALLMGRATEELAIRSGPGLSAFLLATFGNATELIIAVVAVDKGHVDLARASLVGSIIINVLLVLGMSFLAGGYRYPVMSYSRITASATISMLTVSVVGVLLPSLYFYSTYGMEDIGHFPDDVVTMSLFVAAVLMGVYGMYMLFSMRTHRRYFDGQEDAPIHRMRRPEPHLATWPTRTALVMLAVTMVCVVGIAELMIGEIEVIIEDSGLSTFFMGVVIIALVGNAAEHSSSILMAWRGRIELSFQIAMGSSAQIALLVIPLLVFISYAMGDVMAMVFTPLGLVAILVTLAIAIVVGLDGQATWFDGMMLVAIFLMIASISSMV
jgi:Ca2+:H+ antiporter